MNVSVSLGNRDMMYATLGLYFTLLAWHYVMVINAPLSSPPMTQHRAAAVEGSPLSSLRQPGWWLAGFEQAVWRARRRHVAPLSRGGRLGCCQPARYVDGGHRDSHHQPEVPLIRHVQEDARRHVCDERQHQPADHACKLRPAG